MTSRALLRDGQTPLEKLKGHHLDVQVFIEVYTQTLDMAQAMQATLGLITDPEVRRLLASENLEVDAAVHQLTADLLSDPGVIAAVNADLTREIQATRLTTARWVLEQSRNVYEQCVQIRNIKNRKGDSVIGDFEPMPALRALELVGKHVDVQAFKEVIEHHGGAGLFEALDAARKRVENRIIDVTPDKDPLDADGLPRAQIEYQTMPRQEPERNKRTTPQSFDPDYTRQQEEDLNDLLK